MFAELLQDEEWLKNNTDYVNSGSDVKFTIIDINCDGINIVVKSYSHGVVMQLQREKK